MFLSNDRYIYIYLLKVVRVHWELHHRRATIHKLDVFSIVCCMYLKENYK